jgi:hypothetical protein
MTALDTSRSQTFEAAADVLVEVVDHCPDSWMSAMHGPLMDLSDVAVLSARSGE